MPKPDDTIGADEAAALLGISIATVYRWLEAGTLPGTRLGPRRWQLSRRRILEWRDGDQPAEHRTAAAGPPRPVALGRGPKTGFASRRPAAPARRELPPRQERPAVAPAPKPTSDLPFDQRCNEGMSPSAGLLALLQDVYPSSRPVPMSRREVLAAFGYRRLGSENQQLIEEGLRERGVRVRPPLDRVGIDDDVNLSRDEAVFAPERVAALLDRELDQLAAACMRLRLRDLLLLLGHVRCTEAARELLASTLADGGLEAAPAVEELRATDWVYVSKATTAATATEAPMPEASPDSLTFSRDEAEEAADHALLSSRHETWKSPQQRELAVRFVAGQSTFGVLPTGSGKSLCFQIAARCLASEGLTLVVSPLIALMADQNRQPQPGVTFLNSSVPESERKQRRQAVWDGRLQLLYLTPEQLGSGSMLRALREGAKPVIRVAIDEAHCVSEWGHSFRVEYLLLGDALRRLGSPPLLLLTATAPMDVREDVVRQLGVTMDLRRDVVLDFYPRDELEPGVKRLRGTRAKYRHLMGFIRERLAENRHSRGIVYTRFAVAGDGDDRVENCQEIEEQINAIPDLGVATYHGQMPAWQRDEEQRRFTSGQAQVMVATNAFGLGIDLPTIDWVVHFYLPPSLLDYYQEIGRGGRGMDAGGDRTCRCLVLYDPDDRELVEGLVLGNVAGAEKIERRFRQLLEGAGGQTGVRGPHEALYDRGQKRLLLPFRPMHQQYTVRIAHMLALQELGVVERLPDNLHRGDNVYAQFKVRHEKLTQRLLERLVGRQERRRALLRQRLDEMVAFCEAADDGARWKILSNTFSR